jgi:predicted 3-demethylubiquinone-9 3-methyltransferase (glyoxalase superfamily)
MTRPAKKPPGGRRAQSWPLRFSLRVREFVALNGGPQFKFNEAISFVVNCRTQAEVDRFWHRLSAGGRKVRCGWLKDQYGISWQVVPTALGKLLSEADPAKAQRVMRARLKIVKLDTRRLKAAARDG